MAVRKIIQPRVENYEINPTTSKVGFGDTIQDTPVGDQRCEPRTFSKMLNQLDITEHLHDAANTDSNPILAVINYRPTLCGGRHSQTVISAISDFYNKVVGSALQSTQISYADLVLFIWLGKEYRAFIKDIDRALTIYNQVVLLHPAFGKMLFDSLYGQGAYVAVSKYANLLNRFRNQIADRVNTHLPMIKGLRWLTFDDLALDNIYSDDPDGKGALIAFKRNDYSIDIDSSHAPLMGFSGCHFWSQFISASTSEANMTLFLDGRLGQFDLLVQESWYVDTRPYIQNLIDKNGFLEDAAIAESFEDKVCNRTWEPVYSSEVIELLKNAVIVTTGKTPATQVGTSVFEDATGIVAESNVSLPVMTDDTHGAIIPYFAEKNLEVYPATEQSFVKALITDCESEVYNDGGKYMLKNYSSGPAIITCIIYYYMKNGNISNLPLYSNYVVMGGFGPSTTWLSLNFLDTNSLAALMKFNCLPQLVVFENLHNANVDYTSKAVWYAIFCQDPTVEGEDLDDVVTIFRIIPDQDNLVFISKELRYNFTRLIAFEAFYNPDAIKGVAGK